MKSLTIVAAALTLCVLTSCSTYTEVTDTIYPTYGFQQGAIVQTLNPLELRPMAPRDHFPKAKHVLDDFSGPTAEDLPGHPSDQQNVTKVLPAGTRLRMDRVWMLNAMGSCEPFARIEDGRWCGTWASLLFVTDTVCYAPKRLRLDPRQLKLVYSPWSHAAIHGIDQ